MVGENNNEVLVVLVVVVLTAMIWLCWWLGWLGLRGGGYLAINYADKEGESIRAEVPSRWKEVDYSW